ncbi:MAG: aminoglycoside phosphotransferase family protein, partial [Propionicimonas sp.]
MSLTNRPAPPGLSPGLAAWVREVAGQQDPRVGPTTPVVPLLTYGLPTRPYGPDHSQVFLCAGVALKIHPAGIDQAALARRLRAISLPDTEPVWIQPLGYRAFPAPGGRVATLWPRVTVLSTLDRPPWEEAARLLARLHRAPLGGDPPAHGGVGSLAGTVTRLRQLDRPDLDDWLEGSDSGFERAHDLDRPLLSRLAELGDQLVGQLARPGRVAWVHGDFHLGHLAHTLLRRSWKLVDVDSFGGGDPAWDLARPAAFYAAGLLGRGSWSRFLAAYREAGGTAVPATGDPWPALE